MFLPLSYLVDSVTNSSADIFASLVRTTGTINFHLYSVRAALKTLSFGCGNFTIVYVEHDRRCDVRSLVQEYIGVSGIRIQKDYLGSLWAVIAGNIATQDYTSSNLIDPSSDRRPWMRRSRWPFQIINYAVDMVAGSMALHPLLQLHCIRRTSVTRCLTPQSSSPTNAPVV